MLQPGTVLGGIYLLVRPLGRGAMGEVWLAQHLLLKQPRAIKLMRNAYTGAPVMRERFIHGEARNALRLDQHPNIVRTYELGLHQDMPYIVMEFVEGGSSGGNLKELIQQHGKFTPYEVGHFLSMIASGLDVAHKQGMIHRDVKPANILLDANGNPKLGDFGLTKDLEDQVELTADGSSMGTAVYMAPEQAQGQPEIRSDIYSLGVVIYEMLAGRPPFIGNTNSLLLQHANTLPPALRQYDQTMPPEIEAVVLKSLAKNPAERFSTAGEFANAYQRVLGNWQDSDDSTATLALGATEAVSTNGSNSIPPCPYQGLFAFTEDDAAFFFGREAFTTALIEAVAQKQLVAVIGPSGSGKSSVVAAGLIANLRQGGSWRVVNFRPGANPFQNLAAALITLLEVQMSETDRMVETRKLEQALRQQVVPLADVAGRVRAKHDDARLLIVADQFEELFTLCQDNEEREHFLEVILAVSNNPTFQRVPAFNLVLTMRADFFGHALSYRSLADNLQRAQLNLGPMNHAELKQAIEGPARKLDVSIEEGLTDRILKEVGERPGDLPLLEFSLTLLWDKQVRRRLTHNAYDEIGGVEKALASYAESVYDKLTESEQNRLPNVFIQMVRPGEGTEDTRRVATRAEIGEENWRLVNQLADARLVVTARDEANNTETVEVVHEALIRSWQRLRDWISADRQFRTWQERLRATLRQWELNNRDEGILLRGLPLSEAANWLQLRPNDLSPNEQAFIQASTSLRDKERLAREQEQAARERMRRRVTFGLACGIVGALALTVLSLVLWLQSNEQRDLATRERNSAVNAQNVAEQQRKVAQSNELAALTRTQRLDLSLLLSLEARRVQDTIAARGSLLYGMSYSPFLSTFLYGHSDSVNGVAISPDGKTMLTASADKTILVWDIAKRQPIGQPLTTHTAAVNHIAFSPNGKVFASVSDDKTVILWDAATNKPIGQPLTTANAAEFWDLAFSPDSKLLATVGNSSSIYVWDVTTQKLATTIETQHKDYITAVGFAPDNKTLVTSGGDNQIRFWDTTTRQEVGEPVGIYEDVVISFAFSPDGKTLAAGGNDRQRRIILLDWTTQKLIGQPLNGGHTTFVNAVAFSPDGKTLLSGSRDGSLVLWSVSTQQQIGNPLFGHKGEVKALAFSPDGKTLASVGSDNIAILWDISASQYIGQVLKGHTNYVYSVALSPDGKTLASSSEDKTVILWDLTKRQMLGQPLTGHKGPVYQVTFSPDGKFLASADGEKTIILWDAATGKPLGQPINGVGFRVIFTPDSKTLISADGENGVVLIDVATRQVIAKLQTDGKTKIGTINLGPDGKLLAVSYEDKTVTLWDLTTKQPSGQPLVTGHKDNILAMAFSPNGKILATGSLDSKVILWDVATRKAIGQPLSGHGSAVYSLAFNSDGKTLASSSDDKTVVLWDVDSGRALSQPLVHPEGVGAVAFSADGKTLYTGGVDFNVTIWNVDPNSWQVRACEIANRNMTTDEWKQFLGDAPYQKTCPALS